jgi:hypothetical protein
MLLPCEVKTESPYTSKEWRKIERIVAEKGKVYKTAKGAKKHIENL